MTVRSENLFAFQTANTTSSQVVYTAPAGTRVIVKTVQLVSGQDTDISIQDFGINKGVGGALSYMFVTRFTLAGRALWPEAGQGWQIPAPMFLMMDPGDVIVMTLLVATTNLFVCGHGAILELP